MSYKVTGPLVVIANDDLKSGDWYGYTHAVVPQGWNDERCEVLVDEGFLEKVSDSAHDVAEPAGPPAKSASKGDWEAYARSQGATDADLDGATKEQLIAAYGEADA